MDKESTDVELEGETPRMAGLGSPWTRRAVFYGLPAVLVLLLCGVIGVSRLNVNESLQVFGDGADFEGGTDDAGKPKKAPAPRLQLKGNAPGALRAVVVRKLRNTYLKPLRGRIKLGRGGTKRWPLFEGDSAGLDVLAANFKVPDVEQGDDYVLHVEVSSPRGLKRTRILARVVKNVDHREPESLDPPEVERTYRPERPDDAGIAVALLSASGMRVTAELPQRFFLRATRSDGSPVQVETRLVLLKGLVGRSVAGDALTGWTKTDPAGLIEYNLMSRHPFLELGVEYRRTVDRISGSGPQAGGAGKTGGGDRVSGGDAGRGSGAVGGAGARRAASPSKGAVSPKEGQSKGAPPDGPGKTRADDGLEVIRPPSTLRRRFGFAVRPAQSILKVRSPVVRPGSNLVVEAETLLPSGILHLDAYFEGRLVWVGSQVISRASAEFRFKVPKEPGLLHLQAYYDLAQPGRAVSTLHVFVSDRAGRDLAARIGDVVVRELERVIAVRRKQAQSARKRIAREGARGAVEAARLDARHVAALARLSRPSEGPGDGPCATDTCLRYLLSRLDHLHFPPAMVANTLAGEIRALKRRKISITLQLMVLFVLGALGLLFATAVAVYGHVKQSRAAAAERQRLMDEFERETAGGRTEGESGHDHGEIWRTDLGQRVDQPRWVHGVAVAAMVVVILFAVVAVVMLVNSLIWEM